VGWH
jgi:hypothetical protein